MKWRAVAWDVDGTLVDSEPRHHRALLAASGQWNADLSDLPNEAFRGVHMVDVWAELAGRYPPGLALEEWLHAINAEYVRDAQPMPTFPGAVEVIRTLAMHGIPQVCVSNSSRVVVTANISSLDIGGFLKGVVTFDDVTAGKPDPEPYHKACKCLGIDAPEVLAVEDSLTGRCFGGRVTVC